MTMVPVRADSRIPKGLTRLKNASTLFVFPLISTITLLSLTSTIFAPNWEAKAEMDWRYWLLSRKASEVVNGIGTGPDSAELMFGWWEL